MPAPSSIRVAALYKFQRIDDPSRFRDALASLCAKSDLRGTLIVAREGVNGTVAGEASAVKALLDYLLEQGVEAPDVKFSTAAAQPFHRMKVRLKREIVTMGVEADALAAPGTHVAPAEWSALIADPATLVVDTRNTYETALGRFRGAVDPETATFREFPRWADARAEALRGRKVAMYCTGGIRCEKATAYLKRLGVEEVFHLRGGVLRYLEEVAPEDSLFEGECFVFDERVSVGPQLADGEAELCRACRHPVTVEDRGSPLFVEGISCHRCHDSRSEADRARYAERQRQVELAAARGGRRHIGG